MNEGRPIGYVGELMQGALDVLNQTLIRRNTDIQPPGLRTSFTLEAIGDVNASVAKGPLYFVSQGAIAAILDLSMEIARSSAFVPEIPFSTETVIGTEALSLTRFSRYPVQKGTSPVSALVPRVPECLERQAIGWELFAFASRFLSLHEQGHYLHGHLHVNEKVRLAELGGRNDLPEEWMKALELQADSFALRHGALSGVDRWDESPLPAGAWRLVPNRAEWVAMSFLGAMIVALVLAVADRRRTSQSVPNSQSTHPSIQCRMYGLMHDFGYIRARVKATEAEWESAIDRAFQGMQVALNAMPIEEGTALHAVLQTFLDHRKNPFMQTYRDLAKLLEENDSRLRAAIEQVEVEVGGGLFTVSDR